MTRDTSAELFMHRLNSLIQIFGRIRPTFPDLLILFLIRSIVLKQVTESLTFHLGTESISKNRIKNNLINQTFRNIYF